MQPPMLPRILRRYMPARAAGMMLMMLMMNMPGILPDRPKLATATGGGVVGVGYSGGCAHSAFKGGCGGRGGDG